MGALGSASTPIVTGMHTGTAQGWYSYVVGQKTIALPGLAFQLLREFPCLCVLVAPFPCSLLLPPGRTCFETETSLLSTHSFERVFFHVSKLHSC